MGNLLPSATCPAKPVLTAQLETISVNGIVISRAAMARETQNHPAAKPLEALQTAARALVIRELLLQEAERLAIVPTPIVEEDGREETAEEASIRALIAREIQLPAVDRECCQRHYDANRARFRSPDLYEVRHILLAAGDLAARARVLAEAEMFLAELARDPGGFAALAAAVSACPSRKKGGALGPIGPGQTLPEFERRLPHLPVGRIAPTPVESRYGLHLVAVDRKLPGQELPFERVVDRIAAFLTEKTYRLAVRDYLFKLAARADIRGIRLDPTAL